MGKTSKDKRDIYYRQAKEEGWRARSAFKLMHIDETYGIFTGVQRAVDLCAAPGSWSQVLARRLKDKCPTDAEKSQVKIIAVDLQAIAPIHPSVIMLQGDITKESTAYSIIDHFGGENQKAQLVLCDGAPDVTGVHEMDEYMQHQLLVSALSIATFILEPGGSFVAKIFKGNATRLLSSKMKIFFKKFDIYKPPSSRPSSIEAFVVCTDFKLPRGYIPQIINPTQDNIRAMSKLTGSKINQRLVPFIACGDLNGELEDEEQNEFDRERCYKAAMADVELPKALKEFLTKIMQSNGNKLMYTLEMVNG